MCNASFEKLEQCQRVPSTRANPKFKELKLEVQLQVAH